MCSGQVIISISIESELNITKDGVLCKYKTLPFNVRPIQMVFVDFKVIKNCFRKQSCLQENQCRLYHERCFKIQTTKTKENYNVNFFQ